MTASKENEIINDYLLHLGFSAKHIGFTFLRDVLKGFKKDGGLKNFLTKKAYPSIAEEYGTGIANVERNIRNAIEKCWESDSKLKEVFQFRKQRPTNRELISILGDKVIVMLEKAEEELEEKETA